ncbi:hypothetical protein [Winogradskyella sp.]|uniref:hypothetical protein n=1 Tax=Winogradskyella sp. TaxID=1883156 RepID=UPI00262E7A95|nr:hypothetical protein [Winogradskyella sp.]
MNNLPSNKVIFITVVSILIYLVIDFQIKGRKAFFQLNYDWSSLKVLEKYKDVEMDSVSYDFLSLKTNSKISTKSMSIYDTFSLNNKYYFRSSSITNTKNIIEFRGLYWINIRPKIDEHIYEFSIVDLGLKQQGSNSVCMIGDSQLTWLDLKYIRKDINHKLKHVNFVGNYSDVFGYKYNVKLLNNSDLIFREIDNIPKSDTYIFFIGAHEKNVKNSSKNINGILNKLLSYESKVILVSPPAYLQPDLEVIEKELKSIYSRFKSNSNVLIIDLDKQLANQANVFMEDGIHLNKLGREILTANLIESLK